MSQKFPSPGLEDLSEKDIGLEVFSDALPPCKLQAKHYWLCDCFLKCFSRHQASVTLSSCEAELDAIQAAVQEAIGLLRSLSFVLHRIQVYPMSSSQEDSLHVVCPILLWTDSLSGKMLLEGTDLQRRSRHIDIKVNWLRELLAKEILQIAWRRGAWLGKDMADMDRISTDGQCVICTKTDRKINNQWDSDHVLGMTDGPMNFFGHRQVKAE